MADLYVDNTVVAGSTYNPITRLATGGTDTSYTTIQAAVNAMVSGDDVWIRGALGGGTETYLENVSLKGSTHPNGTIDNWCSLQSYPGEWAKIDGQSNAQYTIGKDRNGRDDSNDLAYWKFERLEITGGIWSLDDGGAGLYVSHGPFIIRYCYIHDNLTATTYSGNNPSGVVGYCWEDTIVEYCLFDNNGIAAPDAQGNNAHITVFADYNHHSIGEFGYTGALNPCARNQIRYNHFIGSAVAYRVKQGQLFTGRNPGVSDYSDTYKDYGDNVHHNYFIGQRNHCVNAEQDFIQVFKNIFDNPLEAVVVHYQPDFQLYKACVYNNTFINPSEAAIIRYGAEYFSFTESEVHWGYDLNNVIDSPGKGYWGWFTGTAINIFTGSNGGGRTEYTNPDISNYVCTNNYLYRPDDPDLFTYDTPGVFYTAVEYEAAAITASPREMYTKASSEGSDNIYEVDGYTTRGTHQVEAGVTIADGGIGGLHPYLSGVSIPSYLGATNPDDNAWADGVVNDISSQAFLKAQDGDTDPTWIEGAPAQEDTVIGIFNAQNATMSGTGGVAVTPPVIEQFDPTIIVNAPVTITIILTTD